MSIKSITMKYPYSFNVSTLSFLIAPWINEKATAETNLIYFFFHIFLKSRKNWFKYGLGRLKIFFFCLWVEQVKVS